MTVVDILWIINSIMLVISQLFIFRELKNFYIHFSKINDILSDSIREHVIDEGREFDRYHLTLQEISNELRSIRIFKKQMQSFMTEVTRESLAVSDKYVEKAQRILKELEDNSQNE